MVPAVSALFTMAKTTASISDCTSLLKALTVFVLLLCMDKRGSKSEGVLVTVPAVELMSEGPMRKLGTELKISKRAIQLALSYFPIKAEK